jgi:hypothetical protein
VSRPRCATRSCGFHESARRCGTGSGSDLVTWNVCEAE